MEVLRYISDDGHVEIKIATASLASPWTRFKSRIRDGALVYSDYRTSQPGYLWLTDVTAMGDLPQPVGAQQAATAWLQLPPVMFETNTYTFYLRFKDIEGTPSIMHASNEVVERFNWFEAGGGSGLLSGSLDFLNEPGIFTLKYRYKPQGNPDRVDTLEFRVVSPKLDTKEDYRQIVEAINLEYENLVFKFLTKTFQKFRQGGEWRNDLIWLSFFRPIVSDYIKAVNYIVSKPHIHEQRHTQHSRADRIRLWSPQMAGQYARAEAENSLERKLFRHEVAVSTHDTRENRFVKHTVASAGKRLQSVLSQLKANYPTQLSESDKDELEGYRSSLSRLSRSSFFRNVGCFEGFRQESLVLQKRTGYAQIYRTWLILNSGISLYEGSTQIGTRPIWELYELWCFLKMKHLVAGILGINLYDPEDAQYITENKSAMLNLFKENEVEHTIVFQRGKDADRIELKYQHIYNRHKEDKIHTATTEQRPDIVLNIHKPDGFTLTDLYDAKYRVLDDKNSKDMDSADTDLAEYPPTDAINQMHRYRDAIYYGTDRFAHTSKEIIGGYVLFPARVTDAKARELYYFKSIETVNIGAFPLLPGKDSDDNHLLREHLTSLLTKKTKYQQIGKSVPQRGLHYSYTASVSEDMVLVGYASDSLWQSYLRQKIYYVRAGFEKGSMHLRPGFEGAKYVLLHNDRKRKLYRLDDKGPRIFSAGDLRKIGFTPSHGDYFLVFGILKTGEVSIDGLDLDSMGIQHKINKKTAPFFTTIKELLGKL